MKFALYFLLGAALALMGFPIFPKEGFNIVNFLILILCMLILKIILGEKNEE